ncbi:MAG: FtsH protease activity modulator HflK [Lachnospiraceae bacterium]|nr:FtsH protease activity modulator HflK [Lachnospiraceae bacterium]
MNKKVINVPNYNTEKQKKLAIGIVVAIMAIILIANSFYTVKENEQAVLLTLGNARTVSDSGLHFKIPFIQKVRKVDTTIQGLTMGYNSATNETIEDESLMITSDYNFINVDFFIEYQVTDPIEALYASDNPKEILKNIAQSSIRTVIGNTPVDDVLTTGKSEIQAQIKEMIIERLDANAIGIMLVNITMQDAEPPTEEVMQAFKAVETAKQGKETALNNANKYKNEQLPAAEANVDKILQQAEAKKQERINEANGQVARFNKLYEEYIKYPEVTKQRMFYETMEEILPSLKVVINSSNGSVQTIMPLDSLIDINNSGSTNNQTATNNSATTNEDTQ